MLKAPHPFRGQVAHFSRTRLAMAAIAPASVSDLLDLLRKSSLLSPARLKEVPGPDALPADPRAAAATLVRLGFLTTFQSNQLLSGRHKGFRVGPYAIQSLLGRGGMGAVYLAEHLELRRKVALKVLAPVSGEGAQLAVERFLREGRAAGALDHPNIVRVFDVARHQNTPYLVMEYVEGETLQQLVDREGALPISVAAECVAQAAAGLQHAHERGFIHRDIKPGNLIRDTQGVVKVLDMGLARSGSEQDKLTEQLDQGAVVGTADFISPEQAFNSPNTDGRADIYSLGATLYTLLAGKPPFDGNTTQKLMQHQLKDAPPLAVARPGVPAGLVEVVSRMLAKKPADRYQCGAEVVAALAPWTGNSAHVAAGLSRTNLGQSAARLNRISHSSTALGASPPRSGDESGVVDPSEAAMGTVELRSSQTTKDKAAPAREPEAAPPKRRRWAVVAAGVVLLLASAGVAGWLAAGGGRDKQTGEVALPAPQPAPKGDGEPTPAPQPNPAPVRPPKTDPPGKPPTEVKPPAPVSKEKARFAFDSAGVKPFSERTGLSVDPAEPNKKVVVPISKSGPGAMPAGWSGRCWNKDTEMEVFGDVYEGKPALGLRNTRGPGSAMLFAPRFDAPSGVVRVRFEYAAPIRVKALTIKFKPDDQRPAWEVSRPPVGPGWQADERLLDLKGASGGFFEFHNTDPTEPVYLTAVSVVEPDPASPDRVVFKLDAGTLPDFRNTKTGRTKTSGDDAPRIPGVGFVGYKPETESAWVCGPIGGAKAIGYTNLSDVLSTQIGIELEDPKGVGATFEPGQLVRVRITYRTSGKGRGAAYFQTPADWKTYDRVTLPGSNSEWTTVEVVATRGPNPLRYVVDVTEKGEGNTLFVRSVVVSTVGPPRPVEPAKKN